MSAIKADCIIEEEKNRLSTNKDLRQVTVGRKPQSSQALGTNSKAPNEDGCWLTFLG